MSNRGKKLSTRIVETVGEALGKEPVDLPPLERTISASAIDLLFHEGIQPSGAYTVFPYCGVWVLVHSNGTVNVFDDFKATSAAEVAEPSADEPVLILDVDDERHAFQGDELDDVHDIIDEADDSEEAWENAIEYAEER